MSTVQPSPLTGMFGMHQLASANLTKAELSQKFTSGEYKVTLAGESGSLALIVPKEKEGVINSFKQGAIMSDSAFLRSVSTLLGEEECGLQILAHKIPSHRFGAGSKHLVNLDDDGTYWSPLESGLARKSITGWIACQSIRLEAQLVTTYEPSLRDIDVRFWYIHDQVGSKCVPREGVFYRTIDMDLKSYYDMIERRSKILSEVLPDKPQARPVFKTPSLPPDFGGMKRAGEPLVEPPAKMFRRE